MAAGDWIEDESNDIADGRGEDWTDRYGDAGDEVEIRGLIQLAGEVLESVCRPLERALPSSPADHAMRDLLCKLVEASGLPNDENVRAEILESICRRPWKQSLEDLDVMTWIDWPWLVEEFTALFAYGDSGIIHADDDAEAEEKIKCALTSTQHLLDLVASAATRTVALWGIRDRAQGRWALDHGEPVSANQIALLGSLDIKSVRNAISSKELSASGDGMVPASTALEWLSRRRKFNVSKWLQDGPVKFDDPLAPDEDGSVEYIFVPKDRENRAFLPDLARPARQPGRSSYSIGPKGEEHHVEDYYEALRILTTMPTPRWRRPNKQGNWGIVSASGQWQRMRRDVVDRMIASHTG